MTRQTTSLPCRFTLRCRLSLVITVLSSILGPWAAGQAEEPTGRWTAKEQAELLATQSESVKKLTIQIEATPRSVELFSKRGDAYFFLGQFEKSLADYEQMVKLDETLAAGHWRRGIADFYAGKFKEAAAQFELYHSFDDVDRENGIWRYLSQVKAHGRDKAREGLLKYKKDDREPFPDVYQLFAGSLQADEIVKKIHDAKLDDEERQKRLFYAELYIGLNYDVEDEPEQALKHLQAATSIQWPRTAGYGPHYMWHVGRLHALRLEQRPKPAGKKDTPGI